MIENIYNGCEHKMHHKIVKQIIKRYELKPKHIIWIEFSKIKKTIIDDLPLEYLTVTIRYPNCFYIENFFIKNHIDCGFKTTYKKLLTKK